MWTRGGLCEPFETVNAPFQIYERQTIGLDPSQNGRIAEPEVRRQSRDPAATAGIDRHRP